MYGELLSTQDICPITGRQPSVGLKLRDVSYLIRYLNSYIVCNL